MNDLTNDQILLIETINSIIVTYEKIVNKSDKTPEETFVVNLTRNSIDHYVKKLADMSVSEDAINNLKMKDYWTKEVVDVQGVSKRVRAERSTKRSTTND